MANENCEQRYNRGLVVGWIPNKKQVVVYAGRGYKSRANEKLAVWDYDMLGWTLPVCNGRFIMHQPVYIVESSAEAVIRQENNIDGPECEYKVSVNTRNSLGTTVNWKGRSCSDEIKPLFHFPAESLVYIER